MARSSKKTKPGRLDNLVLGLKKISFVNRFLQYLRNSRTGKKVKVSKSFKFALPKNINAFRIILFSILFLLIFSFGLHIFKYFSLQVKPFVNNDKSAELRPHFEDSKEYNVVYLGFDDLKNDYKFLDLIVVNSVNTKNGSVKNYGVNPYFLSTTDGQLKFTLKTVFNNMQAADENKMDQLLEKIEIVLGIRIDRYIAFNYSDFNSLLDLMDLSLNAIDSKNTKNLYITSGQSLKSSDLLAYLIENETFDDKVLKRYVNFMNILIENFKDNYYLLKTFWKSDQILNITYTDFSKDELFKYFVALANSNLQIKYGFISEESTYEEVKKLEDGIKQSDILIDEDVTPIFTSIPILQEQAGIEIYNATDQSGFAYRKKRVYEHMGANIKKLGNYPDSSEENILYIPKSNPEVFQETIRMIQTDLRGDVKIELGEYKYNYAGDLILVLGKAD